MGQNQSSMMSQPTTIIELASKEGVAISRRQLAEWHRDGLILNCQGNVV